ncbi:MAG: membrane protein insertase YidC, partial [Clostridia bacterium]|nr:membrane protein insertase YidC [Clostridia bacterium]
MSWISDNFISNFFVSIINWLYGLTGSYILSVALFTLLIKLLLSPLEIKQRRNTQRQMAVSNTVREINRRYKHDPRLAQQKVTEFYKKNNISTGAGCLPLLLQMPILFAMFGAVSLLSNYQSIELVVGLAKDPTLMPASFLWVHNIWRPDSGSSAVMPNTAEFVTTVANMMRHLSGDTLMTAVELVTHSEINQIALTAAKLPAGSFFSGLANASLASIPADTVSTAVSMNYGTVAAPVQVAYEGLNNGFYVFPVIAALTTYLSSVLQRVRNDKLNAANNAENVPGSGLSASMEYIMPIITFVWTLKMNVCFAVYWIVNNLITVIQMPVISWLIERDR